MSDLAAFFRTAAQAAAEQTLPRFRAAVDIDNKLASGFDPVTEADRAAERAIRDLIARQFPQHGILGEEYGAEHAEREYVWIIDPIDGTRAFIAGLPVWGTLCGLTRAGDAIAGFMSQPFTSELYFADEHGAHYEGPGGTRRLAVRDCRSVAEAILFTTTPALYSGAKRDRYNALERAVRLVRYGTDCYAFAMLASGHADIVCEPELQSYDIVALIPIIEKAGGVVTRWDGGPAEQGGDVIAAATAQLHEAALDILNG